MPLMNPHDVIAAANARSNKIVQTAHIRAIKEDGARTKAVVTAFQTYIAKAPLAERRAFVEALAVYAKGIAAERIAAFAEAMVEAPVPETPATEASKVETVDTPAKPEKPAPTAKADSLTPNA